MFRHLVIVLTILHSVFGGSVDIEDPCYVSGALELRGEGINGKYVQTYKTCNVQYSWGSEDNHNNYYEIAFENVTDVRNPGIYIKAWVIRTGSLCGYGQVQAINYWQYVSTPDELPHFWYQYDPSLEVYFTNPQLRVECDGGLSGGEIAAIVFGCIFGVLFLGGLLFFIIRQCKTKKEAALKIDDQSTDPKLPAYSKQIPDYTVDADKLQQEEKNLNVYTAVVKNNLSIPT